MQLCKITLRLGASLLHTVHKVDVTPAEILVLKAIHGQDAVVDIIPTRVDDRRRHDAEFARLAHAYDRGAGTFVSQPGEEDGGVLGKLFPGAVKRLPLTLEEIGINLDGGPDEAPEGLIEDDSGATDEELESVSGEGSN